MSVQALLKAALSHYLESGDDVELCRILFANPDLISSKYGEYPDVHRLMDLRVGGKNLRVCRQISQGESVTLVPIDELSDVPGVPLWLTGEKLALWAANEREDPSDEPVDWNRYR